MAVLRLAILALCCVLLVTADVIPGQSADNCDGVFLCLKENDPLDCNQNSYSNRYCGEGLFCRLSATDDPITGNPRGTCIKAALFQAPCSLDSSEPTTFLPCYDPNFPGTIFCDDPFFDGNGTCRYHDAYVPGEPCQAGSNYDNGGCVYGSCSSGSCPSLTSGAQCTEDNDPLDSIDPTCAPGLFCNNTLGDSNTITNKCGSRAPAGTWCRDSSECDPLLVCTTRGGVYDTHFGGSSGNIFFSGTCLEPFYGKEGDTCSSAFDCSEGHFCSSGICIKPSPFRKDFCTDDDQCQTGWSCECLYKNKGNKVTFTGAKCTESEAWDGNTIKQWKKYQQCAKDTGCQDLWWRQRYANSLNYLSDSCSYNCAKEAGADLDELLGLIKQGQCISSAAAVFPLLALIAAIAAVLSF